MNPLWRGGAGVAEYIERKNLPCDNCWPTEFADGFNYCLKLIRGLPAADVRPVVKATWIVKEMQALFSGMDEHPVFACSECGYQIYDLLDNIKERHHFCPNCGAMMEGS